MTHENDCETENKFATYLPRGVVRPIPLYILRVGQEVAVTRESRDPRHICSRRLGSSTYPRPTSYSYIGIFVQPFVTYRGHFFSSYRNRLTILLWSHQSNIPLVVFSSASVRIMEVHGPTALGGIGSSIGRSCCLSERYHHLRDPTTTWGYKISLYHARTVGLETKAGARQAPPIRLIRWYCSQRG